MTRRTPYRSPRTAKRFKVLVEAGAAPAQTERFWVCEGLAKPRRGAHWRFVSHANSVAEANDIRLDKTRGRAIIPTDCTEVDFVNTKGAVVGGRPLLAPARRSFVDGSDAGGECDQ